MQYHLYSDSNRTLSVDYTMRREDAGILGKIVTEMEPTASADTKDAVVEMAYAHLGRNPSDMLYVADSKGQLYQIIINRKYHEACDANGRAIAIAWASFTLSIISFVIAVIMELGYTGLLIGSVVLGLYYGAVRWKIFNEIEACVVCVILLVLTMLLVPQSTLLTGNIKIGRTMRCTQVADQPFPDGEFFCRDWVIANVRRKDPQATIQRTHALSVPQLSVRRISRCPANGVVWHALACADGRLCRHIYPVD
ncbi:MAG: hypothetical protein ACK5YR_10805 [Pirellula sp.]